MADIENLRPEVREAVREFDGKAYPGSRTHERWQTIRAELLRLAGENATLGELLDNARMDRIDEFRRANKAESELAALKARIAGSPACGVFTDAKVYCCVPRDWVGKRVRLLVED